MRSHASGPAWMRAIEVDGAPGHERAAAIFRSIMWSARTTPSRGSGLETSENVAYFIGL